MGVVEYFDQAIFQFETFMEQATQLLEFLGNTLAGITQIGERQQFLSDDINARVKSLGQFQPTLIIEGFRLFGQLLLDTEMASRRIVHQHATEFLQRLAILSQRLGLGAKSIKGPNQFVTCLQPAVDQLVHPTPAFLSILTTFQHDDLSSLLGALPRCARATLQG